MIGTQPILFTSGASNGLLNNLVAHYAMEGTSGAVVDDTGTYDGVIGNSPTRTGTHFEFDGVNDYWYIPDNNAFSFTDERYAISFWVNIGATMAGFPVYKGSNTSNREFSSGAQGSTGFAYGGIFNNGSTTAEFAIGTTDLRSAGWSHICVVADGTTLRVFANGVLEDEEIINYNIGNYSSNVFIGCYGGGPSFFYNGDMKYLGFWTEELTYGGVSVGNSATGQVAALYNSGTPLPYSNFTS